MTRYKKRPKLKERPNYKPRDKIDPHNDAEIRVFGDKNDNASVLVPGLLKTPRIFKNNGKNRGRWLRKDCLLD